MNPHQYLTEHRTGTVNLAMTLFAFMSRNKGSAYSTDFNKLNQTLRSYKRAIPSLLIDLDKLDENIETLKSHIKSGVAYRIVVKSLPSPALVEYIMQKAGTKNLMVFHQPFLSEISKNADHETDILIGKPLPIQTCKYYYSSRSPDEQFNPAEQLQWLIDTPDRLNEYLQFAISQSIRLRINLELDVGLRRGGFQTIDRVEEALKIIGEHPENLEFSGFMGYDAHIPSIPSIIKSREKVFNQSNDFYKKCIQVVKGNHPELWHENLTFNGAGSPTLTLHHQYNSVANDIAAGSCLVKPTDFDIDTLEKFKAASFIATPVLKKLSYTEIPALEKFKKLMSFWNPNLKQSFFIYGGAWMADLYQPPGLQENKLYGKSTNQMMVNASDKVKLNTGDFIFLRPKQSEFVFLQFGKILVIRKGEIVDEWPVFEQI